MANKKKKSFNSKKKSTNKKSNSAVKSTSTSKETTSTTKKKSSVLKKTSVKTTVKKTTTKKATPKTKVENKEIKLITEEPIKVEIKEVSKNKNKPERVIKTEEYTVIKKTPIRYKGKEKSEAIKGKKRIVKSNAKKVEKGKKNDLRKALGKIRRKIKIYGINSVFPIKYIVTGFIVVAAIILIAILANSFGNKQKLDFDAISNKIDQLTTVSFDIDDVPGIINSTEAFNSLKDYYEYDFNSVIGLNPTYVSSYVIKVNKSKKQAFIAVRPVDKYYDDVHSALDSFLKDNEIKNYKYLEYQGYQIYIKSVDEEKDAIVVSKIKQSQKRVFNIMKDLKKDDIEREFKISDSDYEEALVKVPMVVKSDTCGYVIIKPKNQSSKDKIKNLMDDYYKGLEAKWQNDEENRKLVQNRYFEEYKGYLIYLVSHDNNLVIQLLKSSK